jgi:hypothetical protein
MGSVDWKSKRRLGEVSLLSQGEQCSRVPLFGRLLGDMDVVFAVEKEGIRSPIVLL